MQHIEPRGKPVIPLEINIKSNEGLLEEDQLRLTQLVTKFEQRRLKSLIREPNKQEETGFYTKIQGYQTKPKIYNKRNFEFLAATLKHNKSLKTFAYSIELDEQISNNTNPIDQQILSTQTESFRPVTNVREKEKLQNMINKNLYSTHQKELKNILMNKLNSSSVRDLQMTKLVNQDTELELEQLTLANQNITKQMDSIGDIIEEQQDDETKSKISLIDEKKISPIAKIVNPSHSVFSFNIDTVNDKIYFQRVEKELTQSRKDINQNEGATYNLTSQGFIQDYDVPDNQNHQYKPGYQSILGFPDNIEEFNQRFLKRQLTKKDEIQTKNLEIQEFQKTKFSGALDYRMNTLDAQFLEDQLELRRKEEEKKFIGGRKLKIKIPIKEEPKDQQFDLIDEYAKAKEEKQLGKTMQGLWVKYEGEGHYPPTREGAGCVVIEDKVYLMFGFQNVILDDIRCFDVKTFRWENLTNNLRGDKPDKRFNFSCGKYKNKIVIFGGASNYLSRIKQRETFNDIWILTPNTEDQLPSQNPWIQLPSIEHVPERSMMHSGDTFGSTFVIYGGMNKQKQVLNQLLIYDIEAMTWVKAVKKKKSSDISICPKFMHTLTAVIIDKPSQSPKVIQDQPMTPTSDLEFNEDIKQSTDNKAFLKTQQQLLSTTKSTFTQNNSFYNPYQSQPKHDKNGISGLYLFGGMDDQGNVSNDVWHIKPSYSKNLDNLAPGTHEYRENFEKKLFYDISLVKTMGKPPIARYCHQAVCFQSKYLLIHGGRNNKEAYDLTRNMESQLSQCK
eukprot:403352782